MAVVAFMVFAGALAASIAVFAQTLAPAMPRIIALLAGHGNSAAMPQLVLRDRHAPLRARPAQSPTRPAQRAAA